MIDYAIGIHHVLNNVADFQICDFDLLLSDIHCADPNNHVDHSNGVRRNIARKWVPSKCEDFFK